MPFTDGRKRYQPRRRGEVARTASMDGMAPAEPWQWLCAVRRWVEVCVVVVDAVSTTGWGAMLACAASATGFTGRESPVAPKCRKAADISMAINALIMS